MVNNTPTRAKDASSSNIFDKLDLDQSENESVAEVEHKDVSDVAAADAKNLAAAFGQLKDGIVPYIDEYGTTVIKEVFGQYLENKFPDKSVVEKPATSTQVTKPKSTKRKVVTYVTDDDTDEKPATPYKKPKTPTRNEGTPGRSYQTFVRDVGISLTPTATRTIQPTQKSSPVATKTQADRKATKKAAKK